jgi:hypothetical protein
VTVATRITGWWPKTEPQLLGDADLDYAAGLKPTATADAIFDMYQQFAPLGTAVPAAVDGNDLLERYVAAGAVLKLIPRAKDAFKEGYLGRNVSTETGGSANETLYNKLQSLDDLAVSVQAEMALLGAQVSVVIDPPDTTTLVAVDIPTAGLDSNALLDPIERARYR